MAFTSQYEFGTGTRDDSGWLFGIPNPFPFPWGGGDPWGGIFPSGTRGEAYLPSPTDVPDVISEVPQTWEELEEEMPELFEPILETRPGETPDPYPGTEAAEAVIGDPYADEVAAAQDDTEEPMAHDWAHIGRQFLTGIISPDEQQFVPATQMAATTIDYTTPTVTSNVAAAGGDCDGMAWSGGTPPKGYKVVNYCGAAVLRKIRRRRRRRILSASDAADIATIVGLVGKGQMASSLINRRP